MSATKCHYCDKGESLAAIGIEVAKLSASTVYLFREQSHPGRLIVAYNAHVGDLAELADERRNAFFSDLARAAKAIQAVYQPDKINYGAYGDTLRHLHFHLVPKYQDGFEWGGIFTMNPQKVFLTDAEYAEAVKKLRQLLS